MKSSLFESAKAAVPWHTRQRIVQRRLATRQALPLTRALPDFLIIGGQRCGTSSLYKYLGAHPQIVPSLRKETHYFSTEYGRGMDWYRAHFPAARAMAALSSWRGPCQTFEATPDYLFDPRAPERVASCLPTAKFIVILRDPVARAYSHWQHVRRIGLESLSFEDAVAMEPERIGDASSSLRHGETHDSKRALLYSYVSRGYYAEQLERWLSEFPSERFLILDAEELYGQPDRTLHEICRFIGVGEWAPSEFRNYSQSVPQPPQDTAARNGNQGAVFERLRDEFKQRNESLTHMARRTFSW